ncbi:MAG: SCO family protein [Saprospiraceae bacterium]|nr:SCO family protein [Saprospiraceae bacterium]
MNRLTALLGLLILASCLTEAESPLPILGEKIQDPATGKWDYYRAPTFEMVNQLNQATSSEQFEGKVQVVDFFFTSCPTICPKMTNHLKVVQEAFAEEEGLNILSFSIDTRNDTPDRLLRYAERYEVDHDRWSLLTGGGEDIFELAKDYKVRAFDDSYENEQTGANLIHDGTFVLLDGERHIRGYYNGLELSDTQRLISDIKKLLN